MAQIEEITVTVNDVFDVIFAVDHSKITEADWHEMNNFWANASYRLRVAQGDIVMAVLMMLAELCMRLQIENDYNSYGVMAAFGEDQGQEGWPVMDGSKGILIRSVDEFEITC